MKTAAHILLPVLAMLAACDGGTAPPIDEWAGDWVASQFKIVSDADDNDVVDLVDMGGIITLELTENHEFTMILDVPDHLDLMVTGTWSASVDVLTMNFESGLSGQWQFDYTFSDGDLYLADAMTDFLWDFDGNPTTPDPAHIVAVFERVL
jgi:hypothetical protein